MPAGFWLAGHQPVCLSVRPVFVPFGKIGLQELHSTEAKQRQAKCCLMTVINSDRDTQKRHS